MCDRRSRAVTLSTKEDHHYVRKRRDSEHEHRIGTIEHQCKPPKLLDEWVTSVKKQIGLNQSVAVVQPIYIDSPTSIFQLQYAVPSVSIEMTQQQVKNHSMKSSH